MYLSVQLAARRLGVSPHTIRRWTASGVLPCIRTAGGHRRIKQEDVDELARHVAGADGDHLAARLAREREVETLVEASIALTSRLDLAELLGEIARRLTAILDCHFCAVSDYDDQTHLVRVLADFDRQGRRVTDWKPYSLKKFPFSMRLMEEQELAVITVSDPRADPAETAIMRHYGDKTLLLIPLVYQERSVGLLEVLDHVRERRFTRQELRLARALAGLAATALQNATAFALLTRDNCDADDLRAALDRATQGLPAIAAAGSLDDVLRETAALALSHARRSQRRRDVGCRFDRSDRRRGGRTPPAHAGRCRPGRPPRTRARHGTDGVAPARRRRPRGHRDGEVADDAQALVVSATRRDAGERRRRSALLGRPATARAGDESSRPDVSKPALRRPLPCYGLNLCSVASM